MNNEKEFFFNNLSDLKNSLDNGDEKNAGGFALDLNQKNSEEDVFVEDYEGQLSVDVYDQGDNIIVKSTIAGVRPEDLDIYIHDDLLTIRGRRHHDDEVKADNYFYRECYWGGFSRSLILPTEVQSDKIEAVLKNGVLTVVLPKANKSKQINIRVQD